jgi:hypothetical protein
MGDFYEDDESVEKIRDLSSKSIHGTTALPEIKVLTSEEGRELFDAAARRELGISGDEFLRRYDAGEYEDEDASPVTNVVMLLPFAR